MRLPVLTFSVALLYVACQPTTAQSKTRKPSHRLSGMASLRKAAEQGSAEAQYRLGMDYDLGQGVPQDSAQAAIWYRKAAEQRNAVAQNNLGVLYKQGQGVSQNYTQSAVWFHRAAVQGYAEAQYNLALAYHFGHGVPPDETQAVFWWRKAAEQGLALAQAKLGGEYHFGQGVPRDDSEAYFWLDLAASSKAKLEGVRQEDVDRWRDEVGSRLTPVELTRVQERARKWFEAHPPNTDAQ